MKGDGFNYQFNNKKVGLLHRGISTIRQQQQRSPVGGCLFGGCSRGQPAIWSHALSACWLRTIARGGKVIGFEPEMSGSAFSVAAREIGVESEASVFVGFCNHHDNELFRALDSTSIVPSRKVGHLLAYRAVCRDFAVKQQNHAGFEKIGMFNDPQRGPGPSAALNEPITMKRCGYKQRLEGMLGAGRFDRLSHLVFTLTTAPRIVASAVFDPFFDIDGCYETPRKGEFMPQYLTKGNPLCLTVFPSAGKGYAIISWDKKDGELAGKWVHRLQLLPREQIGWRLIRVLLHTTELCFFAPELWESFNDSQKNMLRDAFAGSIPDPPSPHFGNIHGYYLDMSDLPYGLEVEKFQLTLNNV